MRGKGFTEVQIIAGSPDEFERLFPYGECRAQEAAQKEERCLMLPTRVSLGAPEDP